jgi:hypothetical protein
MLAPEKKGLAPELFLVLSTLDRAHHGMSHTCHVLHRVTHNTTTQMGMRPATQGVIVRNQR